LIYIVFKNKGKHNDQLQDWADSTHGQSDWSGPAL